MSNQDLAANAARVAGRAASHVATFAFSLAKRAVSMVVIGALSWWLFTGGAAQVAGWATSLAAGDDRAPDHASSKSTKTLGPAEAMEALSKLNPELGKQLEGAGMPKVTRKDGLTRYTWKFHDGGESEHRRVSLAIDEAGRPVDIKVH